jgi:hypothetical protein
MPVFPIRQSQRRRAQGETDELLGRSRRRSDGIQQLLHLQEPDPRVVVLNLTSARGSSSHSKYTR